MVTIEELNEILRRHEDSPAGLGHELRLNLSEIVLTNLKALGWTQRRLAEVANKREAYITRIVHGQQNCSLDTVGEILYAIGIRAELRQVTPIRALAFEELQLVLGNVEYIHGEEENFNQETSTQEENIQFATRDATGPAGHRSFDFAQSGQPAAAYLD